jgi:hypothetical protein
MNENDGPAVTLVDIVKPPLARIVFAHGKRIFHGIEPELVVRGWINTFILREEPKTLHNPT